MGTFVFMARSLQSTRSEENLANGANANASLPTRSHLKLDGNVVNPRKLAAFPPAPDHPLRRALSKPTVEREPVAVTSEVEIPPLETAPVDVPAVFVPPTHVVPIPVAAVGDRVPKLPNGAGLSGRVQLMFKPPPERPLPLDPKCAALFQGPPTTRFFVVGRDRGLADVLVTVKAGLPAREWPIPVQPVTLRLRGCMYENHVIVVQAGQRLLVQNLDRTMHNVHKLSERNGESSHTLLPRFRPLEFVFEEPEVFMRFKCDVHPWEFAYVTVVDHPFAAVTDANGNFAIRGLPSGQYTIEAHHRKAGIIRREITIEEFQNAKVDFEFHEVRVQTQPLYSSSR